MYPTLPRDISSARSRLREAAHAILAIVDGPTEYFRWEFTGAALARIAALQLISSFDIAEAVPVEESISYEELSPKTNVDESTLRRILGMLMTLG